MLLLQWQRRQETDGVTKMAERIENRCCYYDGREDRKQMLLLPWQRGQETDAVTTMAERIGNRCCYCKGKEG